MMKKQNYFVDPGILPENARLSKQIKQLEEELQHCRARQEEIVNERVEQLRKTQEDALVTERLAALGKLAGSIAHEIRNPLNVISTSAYFLKMKMITDDERIKQRIELIESEVKKTTNIIDTILSLSGMKEPRKERVNIINVLNDAVFDSKIPDSVEVVKVFPKEEIFIYADEEQLNIAFTNIIKNALDAMNNTGKLILGIKTNDSKLEISFADTGAGIAYENMDKVSKPLFTTKERGFGFGLSICKMIIEKHNGKIEIKSEPGKGTVVTLILYSSPLINWSI